MKGYSGRQRAFYVQKRILAPLHNLQTQGELLQGYLINWITASQRSANHIASLALNSNAFIPSDVILRM